MKSTSTPCFSLTALKYRLAIFIYSQEILEKRILQRASESGEQRVDDNVEAIKKRFITYKESTKPVIDYYDKLNKVKKVRFYNLVWQ